MLKKKYFKTKDECEVAFELDQDGANQVVLVCDLNGWKPVEMKKTKQGTFRTRVRFPKEGRYQFRYLVDENSWVNDEDADAYIRNEFGVENGVLFTTPAAE